MNEGKMKAVILAGGLGTRMREETEFRPKPMVEIGGRPILWHIMKIFSEQGVKDFVILTGYKGEMIKRFFFDYEMLTRDFTLHLNDKSSVEFHGTQPGEDWRVTVLDTGSSSLTGDRLLRARSHLNDEPFFVTYGDGLANVNLSDLLDVHNATKATLTISTAQPRSRFGVVAPDKDGRVSEFLEKPVGKEIVNIGYMVANNSLFHYLQDGGALENRPLSKLAQDGQLSAHRHDGFWQPMDTVRELEILTKLWESGNVPWQLVHGAR